MSDDIVVLREYGLEVEATLAATVLEANGIPARVAADTAGGTLPSIALVYPFRLLVHADDADIARDLLDTPVEDDLTEQDLGDDSSGDSRPL